MAEAARDLGISPSATSRGLQRLRDAVGDPLLVRIGQRWVPTDRADQLREPVARALDAAREALAPLNTPFDPSRATGAFVLGLGEELQATLLPAIAARLAAFAPGIDLRVRALRLDSAEEGRRDALDAAIVPDLTVLDAVPGLPDVSEFVRTTLYTRRFVVVGARGVWPTAPSLDAYLAADHVITSERGGARGFMDELLAAHGHVRRVACTVSTFVAMGRVVASGRWLGLMPAEVVPFFGDELVAYPPPVLVPEMTMHLMWHPRQTTRPRHRALRERVIEAVRDQLG